DSNRLRHHDPRREPRRLDRTHLDPDPACWTGVLHGVEDQVEDDTVQEVSITFDVDGRAGGVVLDPDRWVAVGVMLDQLHDSTDHEVQVDLAPALEPDTTEVDEIGEETAEPVRLADHQALQDGGIR